MSMSTNEVSDRIKRSMATTIKLTEATIAFYRVKIRELEAVSRAAQKVVDDLVTPTTITDVSHQAIIHAQERDSEMLFNDRAADAVQAVLQQIENGEDRRPDA